MLVASWDREPPLQSSYPYHDVFKWQPSGKRVHRGVYRTAKGLLINCDCLGAVNIIRKTRAI